jgi:hypothetical protein
MFTVFTPTLDRAYTIQRIYPSLVAQTFRDLEWIVVDDGLERRDRRARPRMGSVADRAVTAIGQLSVRIELVKSRLRVVP